MFCIVELKQQTVDIVVCIIRFSGFTASLFHYLAQLSLFESFNLLSARDSSNIATTTIDFIIEFYLSILFISEASSASLQSRTNQVSSRTCFMIFLNWWFDKMFYINSTKYVVQEEEIQINSEFSFSSSCLQSPTCWATLTHLSLLNFPLFMFQRKFLRSRHQKKMFSKCDYEDLETWKTVQRKHLEL